jgi:hypothetical protein
MVGSDDLQEVVSPLPYPYSAIGLLVIGDAGFNDTVDTPPANADDGSAAPEAPKKPGLSICTGWLVSEDTVLTAGHCVYSVANPQTGQRSGLRKVLGFFPSYSRTGAGGGSAPLGKLDAAWSAVLPEWAENADQGTYYWRRDIGVVRLAQKVRRWRVAVVAAPGGLVDGGAWGPCWRAPGGCDATAAGAPPQPRAPQPRKSTLRLQANGPPLLPSPAAPLG